MNEVSHNITLNAALNVLFITFTTFRSLDKKDHFSMFLNINLENAVKIVGIGSCINLLWEDFKCLSRVPYQKNEDK